jgi:DNA (cytosine-5)-methyltransferase 1
MTAYYNEIDPYAAQWLRNLIAAGHIASGDVDERSIVDVRPDDLRGYTQCHFFAGIGGWSYALRLAGVPDDRPVWTGSCPCQPFSTAGKQRGSADERHLWPAFFNLIRECRPATVFGEQVAGSAGYAWWDHVAADLEDAGYAAAAADLGAHSVGAPHIRQRLYWMAHADRAGSLLGECDGEPQEPGQPASQGNDPDGRGEVRGVGDADKQRHDRGWALLTGIAKPANDGNVGDADNAGLEGRRNKPRKRASQQLAGASGPWDDIVWLSCSDGKARPTQSGLFPLADGIPGRVGRLRAYGNAIVPQVAAAFVTAAECVKVKPAR